MGALKQEVISLLQKLLLHFEIQNMTTQILKQSMIEVSIGYHDATVYFLFEE